MSTPRVDGRQRVARRPGSLDALVSPRHVAVIGASARPGHFGNQPLVNLRRHGFVGTVYAVNPSHDEVDGVPCVTSVSDLPEAPDLAVVVLRPAAAVAAVETCAALGVGAAVVVGAGFAETSDPAGVALQDTLADIAARTGIRVLGPNTLGVANFSEGTVPFVSGNLPERPTTGPLAIVSQSGGCGFTLLNRASSLGIGVGHLAVAGNELDVTIPDLIEHYLRRDDVRAVLCYMEAVRDPDGLRRAGVVAASLGKPVFVMKSGATPLGQRAAAAHTGALATSDAVCDAALRQWGFLRGHSFDELIAAGAIAARFDAPPRCRLGVYAQGGGLAVVSADLATAAGNELATLSPETVGGLKDLMPDTTPGNPFDSGGQFLSAGSEVLSDALELFAADSNIDAVAYCLMPVAGHRSRVYAQGIVRAAARSAKPRLVLHYRAGEITEAASAMFNEAGLLAIDPPEAGIAGLSLWSRAGRVSPAAGEPARLTDAALGDDARRLAEAWRSEGRTTVGEYDSAVLLTRYGIPVSRQRLVHSPDEARAAAAELTAPYVVKVASPDLPHRSDVGGVAVDIPDVDGVEAAYRAVLERVTAACPGALVNAATVAEMVAPGTEILVGVTRDSTFGPVVVVGMGGVLAEVLDDVSMRLPPLDAGTAASMLDELRGAAVLEGHRGAAGIDRDAVIDLLMRLSELALDLDEVLIAVDLNPVIALAPDGGVVAVDALIELRA